MPSVSWQAEYDHREPITEFEVEQEKIRTLRWELDVDPERTCTLEELLELVKEEGEE